MNVIDPLLSVIIPVYNAGKYLHRSVDSVLNQSYTSVEIILVDDGSSDASAKICDEYVRVDKRVRCFHQGNKGVNFARNVGLDHAAGEYITFMDADDEIAPGTFQMNMEILIAQSDIDILQYPEIGVHGAKEKLWHNYPSKSQTIDGLENMVEALLGENAVIPGGLCGKIYKREIWKNLRLRTDMRFCEDMIMMPQVFKHVNKFFISVIGAYRYIWHDDSACHSEYTPAKCFDAARSAYGLYRVCLEYQVNVLRYWNNAVKACINAWSFCGPSKELKTYLKELQRNKECMCSTVPVHRMVKLARILTPLRAAWIKWLLVRILFLNKV
ncbi:glycosyltransferase family 2 protein [Barnesiella viscericola]|uniref:Glycosyltransferase family 2 protein n=1 Tax=Barnesiella viscericola TaxID=397865 RepID=A0A921SVB0_9BACT|nr:glycosyltransferase family A protein [Barnesiella viscericola]HJG89214.1 glycosyltransferase family 2 protein [Barnesiella viscericola]